MWKQRTSAKLEESSVVDFITFSSFFSNVPTATHDVMLLLFALSVIQLFYVFFFSSFLPYNSVGLLFNLNLGISVRSK
jgi:hypothetical protein